MNRPAKTAAALLAVIMLTACGSSASESAGSSAEAPQQTAAETSAAQTDAVPAETAEASAPEAASLISEHWIFGTANFNVALSGGEAQALIDLMTAAEPAPVGETDFVLRNFNLYDMSGESPFYQMLLSKDGSWAVTDSESIWPVSAELRDNLCHRFYQAIEPQKQMFAETYDGSPFTLEGMDIPAGSCWLSVRITGTGTCAGAEDYSLTDSDGNAVGVVLIAADTPTDGMDAFLYACADASQMPPGSYTLTVSGVTTQFAVVEEAAYIQNTES